MNDGDRTRRYATLTFVRGAVVALGIALLGGLLSVLYTVPALATWLEPMGLDLRALRPLHTVFASAFVFLGGVAVVHRYFQDIGREITWGDRWRLRIVVASWAAAGLGIFGSLLLGVTSGREYLGFHPLFSLPIMLGWLCFAWTFFRLTGRGFWQRPVYVTMWGVGCLFFVYSFTEQHAWLVPEVFADPIVDKRVQWKACGTLVGTFNLFVYGSLIFAKEKLGGDTTYGQSRTAYALFGVGLLNSFTNYAHHTYHLPQAHMIKWVAFIVSMIEMVLLAKVVWDVAQSVRHPASYGDDASRVFFTATMWWTMFMLGTSILISVPPLNALVHGTYAITGHAMGTMIGIDTLALAGALTWLIDECLQVAGDDAGRRPLRYRKMRWIVLGFNFSAAAMVLWLHIVGATDGVHRYLTPAELPYEPYRPAWLLASSAIVFALSGSALFVFAAALVWRWAAAVFGRCRLPRQRV